MKILISWIAYNNDFYEGDINSKGPTLSLYDYHYSDEEYDLHLILAIKSVENIRIEKLLSHLRNKYPERNIESEILSITDPIDLKEIKTKVEQVLLSHHKDEIDIFISPGTSMMQLAWYICHTTLGLKTRLFQIRPAKFGKSNKPEKIILNITSSDIPRSAIITQMGSEKESSDNYLITESLESVYEHAFKIAQTDRVYTLITGETGTGKEHLARYIHEQSVRSKQPYISINCSAFSDQLLESRLFGYRKGAFTGAVDDSSGLFKNADGGTIFLDEIGDISPYMQQSLLRVLQEKEITPIGGVPQKIDVRIIAATHRNLVAMCKNEKFRWDLYYRLNVAPLELPNLEERGISEIEDYLEFFIKQKKKELGKRYQLKFSSEAKAALIEYTYPGNVRELENIVERLYVFFEKEVQLNDLPNYIHLKEKENHNFSLEETEKRLIQRAMTFFEGNQSKTANAMGVALNTLKNKMEKYGIEKEKYLN